jgi:hypothetical protein
MIIAFQMQRINFEHIDYSKLSFVWRNTGLSAISSASLRRYVCKLRISCRDLEVDIKDFALKRGSVVVIRRILKMRSIF